VDLRKKAYTLLGKKSNFGNLQIFYNGILQNNIVKGGIFISADLEKSHNKKVFASPNLCIAALLACPLGEFCVP